MSARHNRNFPLELAQVQQERGAPMNREDFKCLGYRDEELTDENLSKAAEELRNLESGKRAA